MCRWWCGILVLLAAAVLTAGDVSIRLAPAIAQGFSRPSQQPGALEREKLRLQVLKLRRDMSREQVHKRGLEIKKLEQETSLEGRIRPFVPLAAVAVAILGGSFGLWRYARENGLQRRLRVEQGIAGSEQQIIEYLEQGKSHTGRVVAALGSLRALTESPSGWRRVIARLRPRRFDPRRPTGSERRNVSVLPTRSRR
jgi:hypothetical protein